MKSTRRKTESTRPTILVLSSILRVTERAKPRDDPAIVRIPARARIVVTCERRASNLTSGQEWFSAGKQRHGVVPPGCDRETREMRGIPRARDSVALILTWVEGRGRGRLGSAAAAARTTRKLSASTLARPKGANIRDSYLKPRDYGCGCRNRTLYLPAIFGKSSI